MRAKQRLYLDAEKKKIVTGAPQAAFLYKAKNQEIMKHEVEKYPDLKKYISGEPERSGVSEGEKLATAGNSKMKSPGRNK